MATRCVDVLFSHHKIYLFYLDLNIFIKFTINEHKNIGLHHNRHQIRYFSVTLHFKTVAKMLLKEKKEKSPIQGSSSVRLLSDQFYTTLLSKEMTIRSFKTILE